MESAKQFDNLINALSELTATQEATGKQINEMKTQMNDRNRQEASTSAQPSTSQQQQNQFGNNQQIVVINKDIEETEVSRNSDSQIRTIHTEESNLSEDNILNQIILDPVGGREGRFRNPYPAYQANQQYWNQPLLANQNQQQWNQQPFPNRNYQFPQTNTYQSQQAEFQQSPSVEVQNPNTPYMPVIQATGVFCEIYGYPNHMASQCHMRQKPQGK